MFGAYNLTDSEPLKNQLVEISEMPSPLADNSEFVEKADTENIKYAKNPKQASRIISPPFFNPMISISDFHI